jgi:hypothetical protein
MMLSMGIFFFAAFVMKPRRREWPAKSPSRPACRSSAAQDSSDVLIPKPILGELAAEIEAAKERPRGPHRFQPPLERGDGAEASGGQSTFEI